MKHTIILTLFLLAACCAEAQEPAFNCHVIPTPQQVVRTDGIHHNLKIQESLIHLVFDDTPQSEVDELLQGNNLILYCHQVNEIPGAINMHEAYKLTITPDRIDISFSSAEGLANAYQSLQYLDRIWNHNIPCMEITDWPDFSYRGWLDDISRGPVTNAAFCQLQQQTLKSVKMNFGSYYTEHSLYNDQYPDLVPRNDIGNFQQNMMANLQCFAHFEKTLRIPFYQYMKDTRANLNPNEPRVYDFLADQIANTIKNYPNCKFFNINCDETEGLGSGHARKYVDEIGATEAYCRHINKVYDLIKPYGKEVLMWGDIVGKDPKMLKKLPKEIQYIVWSYVAQDSYNSMLEPFKKLHQEQGTQFWVAPGVSHWSSVPSVRNYIKNIANLARDGYLAGAHGLINTAWDDSGESLFGDCWHAMFWAAEMAWNPIKNTDPQKAEAELAERERIFNENYQLATGTQTDILYKVGDLASNKWINDWFNTGALMQPLLEFYPSNVCNEMLVRCDSVDQIVSKLQKETTKDITLKHFTYSCNRILAVSAKCRLRVQLYKALNSKEDADIQKAHQIADQYFRQLHELKKEYLRLWDEEADAYSRNIICDRYDHLGNEVLELDRKVLIETSGDTVALRTPLGTQPIYYTLDGRQPSTGSTQYQGPFVIDRNCLIKTVCYNEWDEPVFSERYLLHHAGMGHLTKLNTPYSSYNATYSAGGDNALADGCLGSDNSYADGHWQGYWGEDIDAVYDFGKSTAVNSICMRFLQCSVNWVLAPQTIEVYTSSNGKDWKLAHTARFNPDFRDAGYKVRTNTLRDLGLSTRYLRVVAKNPGPLPQWHGSKGQPSYLFCDEIVIE